MGAKAIVERYLHRNSLVLPKDPEELRRHIAAVVSGARLSLSPKELNELVPKPEKKKAKKSLKSGEFEADPENGSNIPD